MKGLKELTWIKLKVDLFDNRKIKHLRRLPGGNDIVLIWVMLLTMAGRCNAGGSIFLTEQIPYTTAMLADEMGFPQATVEMALNALQQLGMISYGDDNSLLISSWSEHQSVDRLEQIREQERLKKQRQREAKRALAAGTVPENVPGTNGGTCPGTVPQCPAIEEDKEKDTDIDKESVCNNARARARSFE